jgi:hypothetical protein
VATAVPVEVVSLRFAKALDGEQDCPFYPDARLLVVDAQERLAVGMIAVLAEKQIALTLTAS